MGIFIPSKENKLTVDQIEPSQHSTVDLKKNFDAKLIQRSYVENTFNNKTALNANRLNPILQQLKNFPAGSSIKVTYFSQKLNFTDKQSHIVDFSYLRNNVHKCLAKVMNLEIKLDGDLNYEFDADSGQSTCDGNGKIFPGMPVYAGDIFLYELTEPGKLGLFQVVDVNPLAIHSSSHNTVSFVLKEFVDNATIQKLEDCVIEVYYYTKQNKFGSSVSILKRTDYLDMVKCATTRTELIDAYKDLFYSNILNSVVRKDDVYDGYVVEFLNKLMGSYDMVEYPFSQLLHESLYKQPCIWHKLLENKRFSFKDYQKYDLTFCQYHYTSGIINGLHNKDMVLLKEEGEFYYGGFSQNFYDKVVANYTPYETIVATYLETKEINLPSLFTLIEEIGTLSDEAMFYQIPVYIFLCNRVLSSF